MAGDFRSQFVIAIALDNLIALKELRAELKGLRDDAKKPIDFTVNVKPNTADNIAKLVEEKVAQGVEKGTRKSRSTKGGTTTAGTVAFDPASLKKIEDAADKIAKASDAIAKGLGEKPIKIDVKEIGKEVGQAVARELAKLPRGEGGGGGGAGASRLSPARRRELESTLTAAEKVYKTPKDLKKVTELNSDEVQKLLEQRAALIGGALEEQVKTLRSGIEALKSGSGAHGNVAFNKTGKTGKKNAVAMEASAADIASELDDAREAIVKAQQGLLDFSKTQIDEFYSQLDKAIRSGRDIRPDLTTLGDIDRRIKRSTNRLVKSLDGLWKPLAQSFETQIDQLVTSLTAVQFQVAEKMAQSMASINISVPNIDFSTLAQAMQRNVDAAVEKAAVQVEQQTQRNVSTGTEHGRKLNTQAVAAATTRPGAVPLDESPEAVRSAAETVGLRMLAELRKREAKRKPREVAELDKLEHEFFNMDPAKVRRITGEARGYRVVFNERERAVLREAVGTGFGEDIEGGIRTGFSQTRGTSRAISQILPVLKRLQKAGITQQTIHGEHGDIILASPELAQFQDLFRNQYTAPLLAGLDPKNLKYSELAPLAKQLTDAQDVLKSGLKRSQFARREFDVPRWSPIALQMAEKYLRREGTARLKAAEASYEQTADEEQRKALLPDIHQAGGMLQDADFLAKFRERATKRAQALGYRFEPFGEAEQKAILNAMADAAGLKTGEAFGKKVGGYNPNDKGALYNEIVPVLNYVGGVNARQRNRIARRPEEILSDVLSFGGEWYTGDFQGFAHSVFQPEIRELGTPILNVAGGLSVGSGKADLAADAVAKARAAGEHIDPRTGRVLSRLPGSLEAELVQAASLRQRLRELPNVRLSVLSSLLTTHQNLRTVYGNDYEQQYATSRNIGERSRTAESLLSAYGNAQEILRNPGLRLAGGGIAVDPASIRESRRQAAQTIRGLLATAKAKFGASTPEQLQNAVASLPASNEELERAVALYHRQKEQYAKLRAEVEQTEAALKQSTARIEQFAREKNKADASILQTFRQNIGRFRNVTAAEPAATAEAAKAAASAAAAAQIAAGVPVSYAGGGGAGGGGTVPPAPPGGTGGPGGFGGPGDWRDFVSAMKALENVRLTGLASDLKEIAANMREAAKAAKQSPLLQSFISAEKQKDVLRTRGTEQRATEAERQRLGTARDELNIRLRAETRERYAQLLTGEINARRQFSQSLRNTVGGQVSQANAGIIGALGTGGIEAQNFSGLASIFLSDESALGSRQRKFRFLLNRYGAEGLLGSPSSSTVRAIRNAAIDQDALRASLVQTVARATSFTSNPRFREFGPQIQGYASLATERAAMEQLLEQFQVGRARATNPNLSLADRRAAATQSRNALNRGIVDYGISNERQMAEAILLRRRAEDQLTQSLLSQASAEFRAFRAAEQRKNFVERFADKLKSFSMYVAGGALLYGGVAAVRNAFSQTVEFERGLARVQGLVGNRTPVERRQIERGVLAASYEYGASPQAALETAHIFAQTGIGTQATIRETRAALAGQLGAGLEPHQATEMLIAVENVTKGLVTSSDILDRISRVEAKFAVTAQDLSVAIQRVGSLAVQLQPTPIGRFDALDLIAGATTAQVEKTRVTGNQAATSLRFILSRLVQPDVGRQLQSIYGIRLGSTSTQLRPLTDILADISKRYTELLSSGQSGQAAQLLTTVAGARQVNQAAAIFGNWDDVVKAMTESARAWGDTQRRVELQMNTFGFQLDRTKAAFFGFANELLKTTGALSLLKGVVTVLGYGANQGRPAAGFAPLAGGVAALGIGALATKLAPYFAQRAATSAAGGVIAGGLGNLASLTRIVGSAAFSTAWPLLILGGLAAAGTAYRYATNRGEDQGQFAPPAGFESQIRKSDVYQAYVQRALTNGLTAEGLQTTVVGAAAAAQRAVLGGQFSELGPDIFTTDNDRRKYHAGVAEATTKAFVDALARAVPEIGKIADESERTSAALALLKQTSLVSQLNAGYVQAYQSTNLDNYAKQLEENLIKATGAGISPPRTHSNTNAYGYAKFGGVSTADIVKYGFGATKEALGAGIGSPESVITSILGNVFGTLSPAILGTQITTHKGVGPILDQLAETLRRAQQQGETLGQAFDEVAKQAFELSYEEQQLVESIRTGASGSYEQQRDTIIGTLQNIGTPVAQGALRKELNQKALDEAMLARLRVSFPGVGEGGISSTQQTGGVAGSNIIFESFRRTSRQRIDELIKAGQTGQAGVLEATAQAIEANQNRASTFLDFIERRRQGRATARERILDVLLRYGQAEEGALGGGQALRSASVGADIASERFQNAQQLVRGLFEARAQLNADVLRAAAKRGDLFEEVSREDFTFEGERPALPPALQKTLIGVLAKGTPEQKAQLDAQIDIARRAASTVTSDNELFQTLPEEDKKTLYKILTGDVKDVVLSWASFVEISKRIVKLRQDELVAQQESIRAVQHQAALDSQALEARLQLEATQRGLGVRRLETLYGPGTALGSRLSDITANTQAQLDILDKQLAGKILEAQQRGKLGLIEGSALDAEIKGLRDDAEVQRRRIQSAGQNQRVQTIGEYLIQFDQEQRNFAIRRSGIVGGPLGETQTRLQGELPGSVESLQAVNELYLNTLQRTRQTQDAIVQGMTQGFREVFRSFDTFKGPAVLPRIYKPALDTISDRVTNSFVDTIVGPQGIFGEQMRKLFTSNAFFEAELIRQAHYFGITAGFAAVGLGGAGGGVNRISDASYSFTGGQKPGTRVLLENLAATGGFIAGSVGGGAIGTKAGVNRGSNYGSEGAQIGSTLGLIIGSATPLGPIGGAIGSVVGGLLGGLIGGRFGKKKDEVTPEYAALDRIDRNTRDTVSAVENQTRQLLSLDNRLLNVPATFRVPQYAIAGGGGGAFGVAGGNTFQISIQISESSNARQTAAMVVDQLRAELRGAGSYVSPRGTRF